MVLICLLQPLPEHPLAYLVYAPPCRRTNCKSPEFCPRSPGHPARLQWGERTPHGRNSASRESRQGWALCAGVLLQAHQGRLLAFAPQVDPEAVRPRDRVPCVPWRLRRLRFAASGGAGSGATSRRVVRGGRSQQSAGGSFPGWIAGRRVGRALADPQRSRIERPCAGQVAASIPGSGASRDRKRKSTTAGTSTSGRAGCGLGLWWWWWWLRCSGGW